MLLTGLPAIHVAHSAGGIIGPDVLPGTAVGVPTKLRFEATAFTITNYTRPRPLQLRRSHRLARGDQYLRGTGGTGNLGVDAATGGRRGPRGALVAAPTPPTAGGSSAGPFDRERRQRPVEGVPFPTFW